MPEVSFGFNSRQVAAKLQVEAQNIQATGGPLSPRLLLQAKVLLLDLPASSPVTITQKGGNQVKLVEKCTLLGFGGRATFKAADRCLAVADVLCDPVFALSPAECSPCFRIPLDSARVRHVESIRTADVLLEIRLRADFARHGPSPEGLEGFAVGVVGFSSVERQIDLVIAQSDWTSKLLPRLGYGELKLVEVPTPKQAVPAVYAKVLSMLDEAASLVLTGNYDGAVSRCRKVIECLPVVTKMRFGPTVKSQRERIDAFLAKELSGLLDESQRKAISDIAAGLYALGNKAVHAPRQDVYCRADAESILLFTTTLVSYVGRLLATESSQ